MFEVSGVSGLGAGAGGAAPAGAGAGAGAGVTTGATDLLNFFLNSK